MSSAEPALFQTLAKAHATPPRLRRAHHRREQRLGKRGASGAVLPVGCDLARERKERVPEQRTVPSGPLEDRGLRPPLTELALVELLEGVPVRVEGGRFGHVTNGEPRLPR